MIRTLILLAICLSLSAAEREEFTLKDGRVITGTYDDAAEVLDAGLAKVPVAKDQIASRRPATELVKVAVKKAEPKKEPAAETTLGIIVAKPKELVAADAAFAVASNARDEAYLKWAQSADLPLLAVPAVGDDARPSERQAAENIKGINEMIGNIKRALQQVEAAKTNMRIYATMGDPKERVTDAVIGFLRYWPDYTTARGK